MKKCFFILLLLVSQFAIAQEQVDQKLFGSWSGTETDNQRIGLTKNWIMHRFEDGNFVLLFTTVENGKVRNFSETGKWWVDGNIFYEYHNNSKKTDVYTYQVLNETHVKFKIKSSGMRDLNKEYEFIDTKLEDNL